MRAIFTLQVLVLTIIAILYFYFALHLRMVFTIWWFDILLHILGGLWSVLFVAWLYRVAGFRLRLWHCITIALCVGGAWELFEYALGIGGSNFMSYRLDVAKDLVDDLIGGIIAYTILSRV